MSRWVAIRSIWCSANPVVHWYIIEFILHFHPSTKRMILFDHASHDIQALPFTRLVLKRSRRRNLKSTTQGENAQQDADTKRRFNFFKMATELCNLSDIEAALNNSSPDSKAIRFGHTSVEANIDRPGNRGMQVTYEISREDAQWLVNIKKFSEEYSEVCKKLKAAKLRGKQLEQMKLENESKGQWLVDRPIDELNLEELLTLDAETTEFIEKLKKVRQERLAKNAASTSMSTGGSNSSQNGGSSADTHEHLFSPNLSV